MTGYLPALMLLEERKSAENEVNWFLLCATHHHHNPLPGCLWVKQKVLSWIYPSQVMNQDLFLHFPKYWAKVFWQGPGTANRLFKVVKLADLTFKTADTDREYFKILQST